MIAKSQCMCFASTKRADECLVDLQTFEVMCLSVAKGLVLYSKPPGSGSVVTNIMMSDEELAFILCCGNANDSKCLAYITVVFVSSERYFRVPLQKYDYKY
jgi:hypothetical protein